MKKGIKVHTKMTMNINVRMDMNMKISLNTKINIDMKMNIKRRMKDKMNINMNGKMNLNDNMNESEIGRESHAAYKEKYQKEDTFDATNGNEILSIFWLLRRPNQRSGPKALLVDEAREDLL
jgi:hypothetical protein